MPDLLTPLSDICQTQLEASRRFANAVFSGTGKIDRIILDAAHRALDEQLRYAQAVGNTRDLQVLANLQATFWSAQPDQLQSFQQEFMRILAEMQNELGRAAQSYVEQFGLNGMRAMPTAMSLAAPAGIARTTGSNPFAPMMSAWESAIQGAAKMSDRALTAMQPVSRAAVSASRDFADAASVAREGQRLHGNGNGNGNGDDNGHAAAAADLQQDDGKVDQAPASSHPNGNGNGNGHGHGHAQEHAAPALAGSQHDRRKGGGKEAGAESVRAQDEPDDAGDSGNGSSGGGRKSAQNRRK